MRYLSLFLCGDVMTARGIDQILPHPGDPALYEPYMKDARGYVELAEELSGPIEKPVSFSYIWGDALGELKRAAPDLRLINLETAVTKGGEFWPDKEVLYRMSPENIPCITEAGIDFCSLANNHILDWGYSGLRETLKTLKGANMQGVADPGLKFAGAGGNKSEASAPAVFDVRGKGRVVVFSYGSETSGIPPEWAAGEERPGVNLLENFSGKTVRLIKEEILGTKRPGDIVVFSVHWGGNWGYEVPGRQREFAHRLIEECGVDIIHGHSSHHVKAIEVFKDRLILYGAGDFINDYEGIGGRERYRADLSLMYFASVEPQTGRLLSLRMTPTRMRRFRVNMAGRKDALWLKELLNREGKMFGTAVEVEEDRLLLTWQ